MPIPSRNPAVNPYLYCTESAIQNVAAYLGASMPTTDPYGAPFSVAVRSAYSNVTTGSPDTYQSVQPGEVGPEVTVELEEWGREDIGVGMGAYYVTPDGTQTVYRAKSEDVVFLIIVNATSDAQRHFVADAISSVVRAGYLSGTFQYPFNQYIIQGLAAVNIFLKRWRSRRFPRVRFDEPRPFGQYYKAELRLVADIHMMWQQPNQQIPSANIQITATSPVPGGPDTTDPTQTVTPTNPTPTSI